MKIRIGRLEIDTTEETTRPETFNERVTREREEFQARFNRESDAFHARMRNMFD
jgi:hypothetical protein